MSDHPIALHQSHTFSREKQVRFLEALSLWGSVRAACRAVPVAPQTVYRARRSDADFALAWDAAVLVARPHVEDVLSDRALNGVEEPVFYHGEEIARRRRYDSRLLLAHLARLDKAEDRDEVREVAEDFDAALERLRRGERVDPEPDDDRHEAEADGEGPWMDESLPFAERVMLYLESIEEADDAEGDAGGDEADEGEGEPASERGNALVWQGHSDRTGEGRSGANYLPQDRVTPVTFLQDRACETARRQGSAGG